MAQRIPDGPAPDRIPRRGPDRVRRAVGWTLVLAALLTAGLAALGAAGAYREGLDRIARDAAARTTVVGVLLDDAAPAGGPGVPVRVSYVDPAGRPQVGQVSVTGSLRAGTSVRVEVDGAGRVDVPPPSRGDALLSAVTVGVGVTLLGGLLLVLTWIATRRACSVRNDAAWEREWRLVEPQWSGRDRQV